MLRCVVLCLDIGLVGHYGGGCRLFICGLVGYNELIVTGIDGTFRQGVIDVSQTSTVAQVSHGEIPHWKIPKQLESICNLQATELTSNANMTAKTSFLLTSIT